MNNKLIVAFIFVTILAIIIGVSYYDYKLDKRNTEINNEITNLNQASENLSSITSNKTEQGLTQADINLINQYANSILNATQILSNKTKSHSGGGGSSPNSGY